MEREALGARIRELRSAAGLTQEQLGSTLRVTGQAVAHWEAGRSLPPATELKALADALSVGVADLYSEAPVVPHTGSAKTAQLVARLLEVLALDPDRIEIHVHVSGHGDQAKEPRFASAAAEDKPLPGLRFARRVLQDWPAMTDEERQGWQELADAIKRS